MSRRAVVKSHLCDPGRFARSYTAAEWDTLDLAGWMPNGAGGVLELRQCRCRSTLAIEMTVEKALERGMPVPANDTKKRTEDARR